MPAQQKKADLKISSFKDLDAWKACREVRKVVFELAQGLPTSEKYRLADQMIRASRSATANPAEGYGRYHYQESIQFCRQARGTLYELLDHLSVAQDCRYVEAKDVEELERQIVDAIRVVNGFVRYLRSRRGATDA